MVSEISVSALIDSLFWWETAGYLSSAAVVAGCAGESIHELTLWFRNNTWWDRKGGKASALLLIAALATEIPIQLTTNSKSGQIIAILNHETEQAKLEVERMRLPRHLTPDQQNAIVKRISPFAVEYDLAFVPNDLEVSLFTTAVLGTLDMAGWTQKAWEGPQKYQDNGRPLIGVAPVAYVLVVTRADLPMDDELRRANEAAGSALVSALEDCGIPAQRFSGPMQNLGSSHILHIFVGKKLM